jgi:hypothetical protein
MGNSAGTHKSRESGVWLADEFIVARLPYFQTTEIRLTDSVTMFTLNRCWQPQSMVAMPWRTLAETPGESQAATEGFTNKAFNRITQNFWARSIRIVHVAKLAVHSATHFNGLQ